MDIAILLLSALGFSGGASGLGVWLLKRGVDAKIRHKEMQLDHAFNEEMAIFQHQIDRASLSLQIRAGGIFERRAEFLLKYYQAMNEIETLSKKLMAQIDIHEYIGPDEDSLSPVYWSTQLKDAVDHAQSLHGKHRLLLSEELDDQSITVFAAFARGLSGFKYLFEHKDNPNGKFEATFDRRRSLINAASNRIINIILPEFRALIGTGKQYDNPASFQNRNQIELGEEGK